MSDQIYYKFFKNHDINWFGLVGRKYHLATVDDHGEETYMEVSETAEKGVYRYMKSLGFKVKWVQPNYMYDMHGYMVLIIKNKAHDAQLALLNAGLIKIEQVSQPKPPLQVRTINI